MCDRANFAPGIWMFACDMIPIIVSMAKFPSACGLSFSFLSSETLLVGSLSVRMDPVLAHAAPARSACGADPFLARAASARAPADRPRRAR